jgi:hypothetical protein
MRDYPSQRSGLQVPDGPILLDTCVIQNLMSLDEVFAYDGYVTDEDEPYLLARFGESSGERRCVPSFFLERRLLMSSLLREALPVLKCRWCRAPHGGCARTPRPNRLPATSLRSRVGPVALEEAS